MGFFFNSKKKRTQELIKKIEWYHYELIQRRDNHIKLNKKSSEFEKIKNHIIGLMGREYFERGMAQDFRIGDTDQFVVLFLGQPEDRDKKKNSNVALETYKYGKYGGGKKNTWYKLRITFDENKKISSIEKKGEELLNISLLKLSNKIQDLSRELSQYKNDMSRIGFDILLAEIVLDNLKNGKFSINDIIFNTNPYFLDLKNEKLMNDESLKKTFETIRTFRE